MSRTNETRPVSWHEICTCKCRLDAGVYNDKQGWNYDKCSCECDDEFICNPSICECECDKL